MIKNACEQAGFRAGEPDLGRALYRHCINPIMQNIVDRRLIPGIARNLPQFSELDSLVAQCRASKASFGKGRVGYDKPVAYTANVRLDSKRTGWLNTHIQIGAGTSLLIFTPLQHLRIRLSYNLGGGPAGLKVLPSLVQACKFPEATNLNVGALIGKIGEKGTPFLVGEKYESLSTVTSGELFLGINDVGCARDNEGYFPVQVVHQVAKDSSPPECGRPGNSCYDNVAAKARGMARLPAGTAIEFVPTDNECRGDDSPDRCFVWREYRGTRTLKSNGLSKADDWVPLPPSPVPQSPGSVEGIYGDAVHGWVCEDSLSAPPGAIQVYAGGPAGSGALVKRFEVDRSPAAPSSEFFKSACGSNRVAYTFRVDIKEFSNLKETLVYIYKETRQELVPLANSGQVLIPDDFSKIPKTPQLAPISFVGPPVVTYNGQLFGGYGTPLTEDGRFPMYSRSGKEERGEKIHYAGAAIMMTYQAGLVAPKDCSGGRIIWKLPLKGAMAQQAILDNIVLKEFKLGTRYSFRVCPVNDSFVVGKGVQVSSPTFVNLNSKEYCFFDQSLEDYSPHTPSSLFLSFQSGYNGKFFDSHPKSRSMALSLPSDAQGVVVTDAEGGIRHRYYKGFGYTLEDGISGGPYPGNCSPTVRMTFANNSLLSIPSKIPLVTEGLSPYESFFANFKVPAKPKIDMYVDYNGDRGHCGNYLIDLNARVKGYFRSASGTCPTPPRSGLWSPATQAYAMWIYYRP
jgi:hypothetical protein